MSRKVLRDEAGMFLLAGTITTAFVGTYTVWAINKHPAAREKLAEELKGIDWDLTEAKLSDLPYLTAVIRESLRLYGLASVGAPRVVPKGGRQLGPYFFPAGTVVTTFPYTVHRDPAVFKNPLAFEPERWLNPTKEMESAMLAFGGASRVCIGRNLAMMELRIIVAAMLKECPNMSLADSCTDESMELEEFGALLPKARRCELQLKLEV
ncbi:hypothetical protein TWF481_005022 [Arthrobotrys musiformis]|uniref:Cytochrome P450 n=1 Tax=Arthrobotrys musiformis TaxID=47236 RepID=A0AAV9WLM9_9PEZI